VFQIGLVPILGGANARGGCPPWVEAD
jgi:hypothetical protein